MFCGQSLVAINGEVIARHEGLRVYNCTWLKRQGPMAWQPFSRCLAVGWEQLDLRLLSPSRHHGFLLLSLSSLWFSRFRSITVIFAICVLLFSFCWKQEIPARTEKRAGAQKAAHQEAAKRLHALHERDACERGRRVHAEGERRHQSDPGTKGRSHLKLVHRSLLLFCCSLLFHINFYHQKNTGFLTTIANWEDKYAKIVINRQFVKELLSLLRYGLPI